MPFAMASSRKPLLPEPPGTKENLPTRRYASRPVVADFRPFIRKSETRIKEFTARGGGLTDAMLYYQEHG
jgi:hypothetical protein